MNSPNAGNHHHRLADHQGPSPGGPTATSTNALGSLWSTATRSRSAQSDAATTGTRRTTPRTRTTSSASTDGASASSPARTKSTTSAVAIWACRWTAKNRLGARAPASASAAQCVAGRAVSSGASPRWLAEQPRRTGFMDLVTGAVVAVGSKKGARRACRPGSGVGGASTGEHALRPQE